MSNKGAWLTAKQAYPLKVDLAPYPKPSDDEVVVQIAYVAFNPADWKIVKWGHRVDKFPIILGSDVAGKIVEVGKKVTSVQKGDRVIAHLLANLTQDPREGAFQLYGAAKAIAVANLPDEIPFERAVVLPLAISTATVGLYTAQQLALPLPTVPATVSRNEVLLVWGGSSSVGATAIQLAKSSGFAVATTCSPRNISFVKSLGAEYIFDYSSPTVAKDVIDALQGKNFVGAFNAIGGEESGNLIVEILKGIDSPSNKKHMATVPPQPERVPEDVKVVVLGSAANIFIDEARIPVAAAIWNDFLPKALKAGQLQTLPEPLLAGQGLESIQKGLDTLEAGVSAKKVVVKVQDLE